MPTDDRDLPSPSSSVPTAPTANVGYALGQIARALTTQREHADARTAARAAARVERWDLVVRGMLDGSLHVGSRTPVADWPAWVTLEVVKGGFATGRALAGGEFLPHEHSLIARLGDAAAAPGRLALNLHYLSMDGLAELHAMLRDGTYRVRLPEEGALLAVAWLLAHDRVATAHDVLDAIAPYFDRLRFYPEPAATPASPAAVVYLQPVSRTLADLAEVQTSARVETMNESLRHWAPLSDRAVSLWLETVRGPAPRLRVGDDGSPVRREDGNYVVDGGWPARVFPDGWHDRARALLEQYERERREHTLSRKPDRRNESFARLRRALAHCVSTRRPLPEGAVGSVRAVLAGILAKRGAPGSERLSALRAEQARVAGTPTHGELATLVARRLRGHPADAGIADVEPLMAPVTGAESRAIGVPARTAVPEHLREKLLRSLEAPVDTLVDLGVIPSGEVLAQVVPQVTSQVRAAALSDPELRGLYGAVYAAFRRRRSLLLLDLSSQVKLAELPWVRAMESARSPHTDTRAQARVALGDLAALTLTAFPHAIVPNKLLQELRSLAQGAGLELPLVDELAADIFVGTFSVKFLQAAKVAARMLRGTLYERYYGAPFGDVLALADARARWGTPVSAGFAALCERMAGATASARRGGSFVARNGMVIEQQQVLTTQNLAVLFDALDLSRALGPRLPAMAQSCFAWVCRQLQIEVSDRHARLQAIKNAAYAFRQMVFYLALLDAPAQHAFVDWMESHLAEQDEAFRTQFAPVTRGLAHAVHGGRFEADGRAGDARRFLGWASGGHWLGNYPPG